MVLATTARPTLLLIVAVLSYVNVVQGEHRLIPKIWVIVADESVIQAELFLSVLQTGER